MRHCTHLFLGLSLVLGAFGCTKSKETADAVADLPDWLAEEAGDKSGAEADDGDLGADSDRDPKAAERTARLELNLKPGDRFPLRKVIDVELHQPSASGAPDVSRRRLDMLLMITVGEQDEDRTLLQVRYDRIHYLREVAGERVEFDSRQPPTDVPPTLRMYRDMVLDGFSFGINRKNQITDANDFKAFLMRCLRNIPESQRQQVIYEAEGGAGENGITDFIDNSIGLLPYGQTKPGDSWDQTRNVATPVPMIVKNTYTLEELGRHEAIIGIRGRVAPSTTAAPPAGRDEVRINVVGGQSQGSCTVFRETGLPRESRVETVVDMLVQTGGVQFTQQQKTITTIESYPSPDGSRPEVISASHDDGTAEDASGPRLRSSRLSGPRLR